MTMSQQTLMALKEASSLDTAETVPVTPVPVSLVRADPTPDTETGDSTVSDRVRLNDTMPEEDDIESSIFIKLQPCILRCTSDLTQETVTWELQGRDPFQDAFYYQSSEIVADAKSLGAEVVRESHLLGQDDAPLQMSCSLIPYAMSNGAIPSDLSQPSKKTDMTIGNSTWESPTCDLTSYLPEDEAFSPKTRQNIVNMSVHNMITDSLEKSIKDVIKTTILEKNLLNGTTQHSIPSAPQTRTDSTPDELQIRTDLTAYDVNSASSNNTPANHLKDTATDSDIKTPLVQVVVQTGQQSVSDKQALSTSASEEVLPLWQTQEIVTMSVQDMTESTETTAECVQSVSMESSESPNGDVSKQCDQTTQFMVTLPLENSLLWQTPETMECISKEVQKVLPVHTAFHPMPPLPAPETCVPEKNVISCTNQAAIKEVIAVSRRDGKLTPVLLQEIPVTHTRFSQEPTRFSQEPTRFTQEPTRFSQELTRFSQELTRFSQEPTRLSQEPTRFSQEPTRLSQEPTMFSQEPTRFFQEPTRLSQEPTRLSQEPTRLSQEPTRFSQEPILITSISPSQQTCSETFISSVASNPLCPDKRKLLDKNHNFEEPPQKQFCLNSRVAASISHPVLFQELTTCMPPLLRGQPQGGTPPVVPHFVQQGDTLPVLRSKLQPGDGFSNTVPIPPNYCTASATWLNASNPNPNINFPGVPISQCQPLKGNCRLSGLQSDCIQVKNSAYTLPKYPLWTQEGPIMSTHPQIPGESSVFPGLAKRPVVSQPAIPQVMTNTPRLTSTGSLCFPLPDIHLQTHNFSRMPTNVQRQERPTLSQLPPVSYFSSLRPPIKELRHGASLVSNGSCNFHQDKFRASTAVDRNQILQCIRRPPPPYQVHPNRQDSHTITHLPRRASDNFDHWRTDRLLQPAPHTDSIPAPNREAKLDLRQAISLENYKNVSCLNCAVTIPTDDKCRVLKSDVVAVLKNAIDLSLPPTAEKPSIILCKCCEEVMHTICSSRQLLIRTKEKFISSTSPEGYLRKKTYSTIEQHFCVNCNVMITSKAKRRRLFSQKNDKWVVANVIQTEFNISLAPEKKHRKMYLCVVCYNKVKQIRSAQVSMSMAMKDFNLRMSPTSHMFMFNQRFQGSGILT